LQEKDLHSISTPSMCTSSIKNLSG